MRKIAYLILAMAAGCVYSCSTNKGSSPTSGDTAESGNVSLPLVTIASDGRTFRLDNASFRFVGPVTETISAPAEAPAVQVRLPVGTYSVELLAGWQLSELLPGQIAQHVSAVVAGNNPLPLIVTNGGTTEAVFQLQLVGDGTGQIGTGRVRFEVLTTCTPKGIPDCRIANIDCGPMPDGCNGTVACGTCGTGQTCSTAGKCVCPALSCTALGAECGTVTDACGTSVNCGTCATGKNCDPATNKCVDPPCVPTTCTALGQECGSASNGCGTTLDCGSCLATHTCTAGKCVPICTPITTCAANQCGTISDGCGGTIACGSCGTGQVCSNNVCIPAPCVPKTCAELGAVCGSPPDGCGGTLSCGGCPTGSSCTGAFQCVCQPTTCAAAGAQCGTISDGCNGSLNCGSCATGLTCNSTNQCTCTPRTCASAGAVCGSLSDGCGGTLSCGTCPTGQACNASNQCACVPTTCSALGLTCGSVSDGCGGTLTCGTCPSGQTCTANKCQATSQITVSAPVHSGGSPWAGGACMNYTVTNKATTATKNWNVVFDLKGATVNSIWNATRTTVTGGSQFTAANYNAVIAASGTVNFGFCTAFTGAFVAPVLVSANATY